MIRPTLPLLFGLMMALGSCGGTPGLRKDDAPVVVSAIGRTTIAEDPSASALDLPQRVLLGATAQGLVRFDAAGQIEPGLAERWIVIDDGRSYIFRLRESARWRDGTPVTAEEVVRVLRRAAAPGSKNPLAPFLAVIDEVVEMTPQVIEVRLKRPRPDLLKLFAQPELAMFRAPGFAGSGPFRLQQAGGVAALRPIADSTQPDNRPEPEDTVRLVGERAALAIARFKAQRSDLVLGGSFLDWPILVQADIAPANIRVDPAQGLFGLAVTHHDGFLAETENRAAIAMAIDRAALTAAVMPDWKPSETLLPAQLDSAASAARPGWAVLSPAQRVENARAQVAAWRRTHPGPLALRIALPAGPGATLIFGHIGAALRRIGIAAERVAIDAPADLKLIDAVAPYDSGRWYVASACIACSDQTRSLIEAGRYAVDLPGRAARIAEADLALTAEASYIPIAQPLRWSLVAMRLGAWQRNARAWHPLNHLRKETE